MRALLLVILVACGGAASSSGIDGASTDGPIGEPAMCNSFRDDPTYLTYDPPPNMTDEVVLSLYGVNWYHFVSPLDPNVPPVPGFIGGLINDGSGARESGPIVEVSPETFRVRGVMWNGDRGKAVILDPIEDDRCQWVTAR